MDRDTKTDKLTDTPSERLTNTDSLTQTHAYSQIEKIKHWHNYIYSTHNIEEFHHLLT